MKKVAVLLLFIVSAVASFAQPITRRAMDVNTVSDARLQAQYNLLLPRYTDTTAANLAKGIDSCGAYIYTYTDNATWVRGCSPKRWIKSGTSIVTDNTESVTLSGVGDASDPLVADVNISTTGQNALQLLPDGLYVPNTIRNGIIWGGEVVWVSGYTYTVKAAGYYIAGNYYESPETSVTLSAADDDSSRIDLFAVNTSSLVEVVEGELSPAPTEPSIDAETQLRLSIALVEAGTTEPSNNGTGLRRECIYKENTEWTALSSAARINVNSTNSPCVGTKSVEATSAVNGDYVTFTRSSAIALVDSFEMVTFQIKSKANWGNNRRLYFRWYSSGTAVGSNVILSGSSYGFSSNLSTCQTIVIPLSAFALTSGQMVDALRVTVVNSNGSIGFYLDEMCLQNQEQPVYSTPITLQNGLNLDNTTNIGELGGTLLHNTTNNTNYYVHTLSGNPVYNYPYQFQQAQNFGNSTSIASFKSIGAVYNTSADYNNAVRLGINYTSDVYNTSPATEGYFGDRIGYMLNTNLRGHGSFGLYQDDSSAKNVGIFFHTKDNSYTDGITLFAGAATNTTGDYSLAGLKTHKVAIFKTDQSIQFPGYGSGTITGTAAYYLAVDANGNVIEEVGGGGGGSGTVTSVGLSMPSAFNVASSPVTTSGTLTVTGAGSSGEYIDGTGALQTFPTITLNTNVGSGYRILKPDPQELKTLFVTNGILVDSTTNTDGLTFQVDSSQYATQYDISQFGTGTVTSVGLSMPSAFSVASSPVTTSGTLTVTGAGTTSEYIRGDGTLATFPTTISGITADNGLTANTSSNVRLGGTLLQNTTVDATSAYQLTATGSFTDATLANNGVVRVINTLNTASLSVGLFATVTGTNSSSAAVAGSGNGSTTGVYGGSSSGSGVVGISTSGLGGDFRTTSGIALNTNGASGLGANISVFPASTNTQVEVLRVSRSSSGTGATGIGGYVTYYHETSIGANKEANRLLSKWADATDATRTSQFEIWGVNSATTVQVLTVSGLGYLKLEGITATAASAITAADGMIVYVTNTDATFTSVGFWARENGVWVKL
jgi:hypothetical protein